MQWIIAVAIVWFVLRRHRRRMWALRARARESLPLSDPAMRRPMPAAARESEFDALKRRYVTGELSDEQYEAELDVLFRTAEGRLQA